MQTLLGIMVAKLSLTSVAPYAEPFRKIQLDNEGIPYCKIRAGKYAHLWDGKVVNGTDYA